MLREAPLQHILRPFHRRQPIPRHVQFRQRADRLRHMTRRSGSRADEAGRGEIDAYERTFHVGLATLGRRVWGLSPANALEIILEKNRPVQFSRQTGFRHWDRYDVMQSNWLNNPRFWLALGAMLVGTLFLGYFLAVWSAFGAVLLGVLFVGAMFFFLSPRWWWIPIPASFAAGGVMYFGFKLYAHELMMLLCSIPLFFAVALRFRSFYQYRAVLPWTFYLLGAYLCAHLAWSIGAARILGEGGTGNILRHYSWALWPLIFGMLFVWFGSTKYLKTALYLILGAYLLRVVVTILSDQIGGFFYIPYINYVLPGSSPGETDDLRNSGLGLAAFAVVFGCVARRWWSRTFFFGLLGLAFVALLLGGGRTAIAMGLLVPIFAAVASKRFTLIASAGAAAAIFIAFINFNPAMLDHTDSRIQRTLSILVFEKGAVQAHADTAMSNYWHERLRVIAVDRWTADTASFFFGNRVKKFDAELLFVHSQQEWSFERAIDAAVDVGAYETGWFATLANTGLFGLACYLALILQFIRRPLMHLFQSGVSDMVGAISFISIYYTSMWVIFGWTFGAYPSFEVMLLIVANVTIYDHAREQVRLRAEAAAAAAAQSQALAQPALAEAVS